MSYDLKIFSYIEDNLIKNDLLLELVSTKDDIKFFCNFVTSMMIFWTNFLVEGWVEE